MNTVNFFLGKVKIKADFENTTSLLNLCMYYKIPYSDFKASSDGVSMCFTAPDYKKFEKESLAREIKFSVVERKGIPFIFERYKYRHGIVLGVILAIALVIVSQRFVWSIDVTGNESLTSAEIISLLKDEGFGIGSYIPTANTDRIENKMLIDTALISWMSINIIGTHAEVQVREYEQPKNNSDQSVTAANIVASKSGVVEDVRVYQGNVVVAAGAYVEKGDLLVSGLYDSERVGFRYTRASGEVMARTTSEFVIEIPYEYVTYEYTGEQYYDKYLNFFDYLINISKNSGKEGAFYDKIDMVEKCCLFGRIDTPFSWHTVKYSEYVEKTAYRTESEAEELAYFELSKKLSEMADDSIILRKTIIPRVDEDSFSIFCTVVAIENIAETSEFEVDINVIDDEKDVS